MPSTRSSDSESRLNSRSRAARGARWAGAVLLILSLHSCQRQAAAFDSKEAFAVLTRQCAFGPRVPGTAAHDSCFAYIVGRLRAFAPVVEADTFSYDSPDLGREVKLMNVLARFEPKSKERILFTAHWDSRPWADRDPNPALRNQPVLGANDGASGVAVLIEIARSLKKNRPALGVDIALFDGEDLGTDKNPSGFFRGSTRFVEWRGSDRPIFAINLDMVGKRNLTLYWEAHSREQASNIVDLVWNEAQDLGLRNYLPEVRHRVFDDHIPFLNAGIPAIDLIDFDFPEWHTTHDTPAVCSPASLEAVGRVLLSLATRAGFLSR